MPRSLAGREWRPESERRSYFDGVLDELVDALEPPDVPLDAAPEPDDVFAPLVVADPDEPSLDDDAVDFSLLVELSDLVDFELEPESVL